MPFAIVRLKMGSLPDCTGNIPIRPNSQTKIDHGSKLQFIWGCSTVSQFDL